MVLSAGEKDDKLEASIWNLESAPSSPVDEDPIRQIRMAAGNSSPHLVGHRSNMASGQRSSLQSNRQVRSESNLSPILDRLRMVVTGASVASSSPTMLQQSQSQTSRHLSLPKTTSSSSELSRPTLPQVPKLCSPIFHIRHDDESKPRSADADSSASQVSLSIDGLSLMELDDSNASPAASQQPLPLQQRQLVPSPITEFSNQWNNNNKDADYDDDTCNGVELPREGAMSSPLNDTASPVIFLGFALPLWCSKKPRWTQVSEFVVRYAPCFICCSARFHGTDRAIVSRLNILNAIFALGQVVVASWFAFIEVADFVVPDRKTEHGNLVQSNPFTPNLWNPSGSLTSVGLVGFVILVTNLIALGAIRQVNLLGATRYLWVITWMVPFEIYCSISLFDYHRVTDVWVRKWWNNPALAWFRFHSCAQNTANTLCSVPIGGGAKFASETEWCEFYYHANNCTQIRDSAQAYVTTRVLILYYMNSAWGVLFIFLLLLTVNALERIISKPIVQKSRESNVPAWLTLPIIGCVGVGSILLYSTSSVLRKGQSKSSWIALTYLVTGGLFLIAAGLGWFISAFSILSSRDKRSKHLAVILFIVVTSSATVLLAIVFASSIIISANLVNFSFIDSDRAKIACSIDQGQACTGCDDRSRVHCDEWSTDDVTKILHAQLKQSATVAAIFIMYAFSTVQFGFVLRKHITMYQIDYV